MILAITVFSLVSTLVFTIYASGRISEAARDQYNSMIAEISEKQSRNIEAYFASLERTLALAAADTALRAYAESYQASARVLPQTDELYAAAWSSLAAYVSEYTGIAGAMIYSESNSVLINNSPISTLQMRSIDWLHDYDDYIISIYNDDENGRSGDFHLIAKASLSDGVKLLLVFDPAKLKTIFAHSTFPANGRIILFDSDIQLLDTTYWGNLAEINMPEYREYKNILVGGAFEGDTMHFTYEIGKNTRIALLTAIGGTGWYLGTIGEADKAYIYSSEAEAAMVNCTFIIGFAMFALGIVCVLIFTKPLYIIEETLVKIRRGDHEARIPVTSRTEYGDIANAFNDILDDVIVSEGRYKTIIEMSDDIIFEWNFTKNEVIFSNNFNKKFSYRAPSDSYEDSFLLKCKIHPEDSERYKKDLARLAKGEVFKQNEYRWKNIYGDYIWILMRTSAIHGRDGEIIKVVGVIVDIDRAKKSEKILTTRASYDALTGLYNRETVESLINNEIELISARKNEFAILFVDVDDFKQYNDNYSHATGDQVLKFSAKTMSAIVSEFGIAGRYGGDEFVLCVRNAETNDPSRVAQEILNKLKEGFVCDVGERLSIEVSIGIAIIRDSSRRVDEIIGMADDAMYKIKKSGKSNFGFIN